MQFGWNPCKAILLSSLLACTQNSEVKEIPDVDLVFVPIVASGDQLEDPLGRYSLTNNFEMMTTELGLRQFELIMEYDSRLGKTAEYGDEQTSPAHFVNWHMAADLANRWSSFQQLESCYQCDGYQTAVSCQINPELQSIYACKGFRLPTEAEWELAARAGSKSEFWTGEGDLLGGTYDRDECQGDEAIEDNVSNPSLSNYAWYCGNNDPDSTKIVGTLLPNSYDLHDMHGNVWEWTHDSTGDFPSGDLDPVIDDEPLKVIRGGSFHNNPYDLRVSFRSVISATSRMSGYGFRLVRTLE